MSEIASVLKGAIIPKDNLKTLQIKCHLGLGDAFVMQGMVHYLLMTARYRKIVINSRKAYLPDMERLYHHVRSSIEFQVHEEYGPAPEDWKGADEIIRLGYFSGDKSFYVPTWDREFYRQAKIPFVNRWLHCYIPHPAEPLKRRDFVIRHHDPARKFLTEGLKPDMDICVGERERILDWVPELMAAKEIHCIDSCVLSLVESMWHLQMIRPDATLCYHAYARQDPPATMLAPWKVLK